MAAVENVEWLNRNLLRAYPLREDSDMTPLLPDGTRAEGLRIPTCLITDFSFTVAFDDVNGSVPCLTGMSVTPGGVSIEISLGGKVLTSVTADMSDGINSVHRLVGAGDNADCGGWLVTGDLARAAEELPEGSYRFADGQVPFEISTLRMAPRGVRSISTVGKYGLKTSARLYGNVRIIAGSDMNVRKGGGDDEIWLEAESGTGYERTEPCSCSSSAESRQVRSINGMRVRDVVFVGGACLRVEQRQEPPTVTLSDTCSTPCCGCSELNFVESAVATINRSISTLQGYADALRARMDELVENLSVTKASLAAYPK